MLGEVFLPLENGRLPEFGSVPMHHTNVELGKLEVEVDLIFIGSYLYKINMKHKQSQDCTVVQTCWLVLQKTTFTIYVAVSSISFKVDAQMS